MSNTDEYADNTEVTPVELREGYGQLEYGWIRSWTDPTKYMQLGGGLPEFSRAERIAKKMQEHLDAGGEETDREYRRHAYNLHEETYVPKCNRPTYGIDWEGNEFEIEYEDD